jgi:pimeloyl-ACP methyl ester carboxylesterase
MSERVRAKNDNKDANRSGKAEFFQSSVLSVGRDQFHRIAFTDWGKLGRRGTVICVHGLTRQGRDFDWLARALAAQGYRVICPDVVGRGLSDHLSNPDDYDLPQYVIDMTALLASIGATSVIWIGFSLGGLIGMTMAGMSNSPIARLVVNDIGPHMPVDAVMRIGRYVSAAPRFPTEQAVDAYFREILAPFGQLSDEQWHHLAKHSVAWDGEGAYRLRYDPQIVRAFKPPWSYAKKLWSLWDRIRCPTLILRGAQSDLLLRSTAQEMLARNRNARMFEFAGCGHLPPLMAAEQIQVVTDWMSERSVTRTVSLAH